MRKALVIVLVSIVVVFALSSSVFASPPDGKGWRRRTATPSPYPASTSTPTSVLRTATPTATRTGVATTPTATPVPSLDARTYAVSLVNRTRAAAGVAAVVENSLLDTSAQAKATDMGVKDYFSHVSPNGWLPWDWMIAAGARFSWAAENIGAINPVDWSVANQSNVIYQLHTMLVNSPAHYSVMTAGSARKIGIGFYLRTSDAKIFYVEHYTD